MSGWDIQSELLADETAAPAKTNYRPTHLALMQLAFLCSYFERDGSKEVLRVVSVVQCISRILALALRSP